MGVPFERSQLYYESKILSNNMKLNEVGVTDGGLLYLTISMI